MVYYFLSWLLDLIDSLITEYGYIRQDIFDLRGVTVKPD